MTTREDAVGDNNALRDERTRSHETSAFYDLEGFRRGGVPLRAYELDEIGRSRDSTSSMSSATG